MAKKNNGGAPQHWSHSCPDNVEVVVAGNLMTITVDLSVNRGLSSTGKSQVVGTTRGFLEIPTHPGVSLSLNVTRRVQS